MIILLLFILVIILILGLYALYRLVIWIHKKKIRIKLASGLVGVIVLTILINHLFFKNMEFTQSEVYPNLYLVKYPIKYKDSIHKVIEKIVLEKVNTEFLDNNGANEFSKKLPEVSYHIRFYEYYTGTPFFVPFGEAGTVHFIENEEDPGGFSSEELSHYNEYRIAEFNLEYCKNDTLNFVGRLSYYQGLDVIKTDTIINQCVINKEEESSEDAEPAYEGHYN